MSRKTKLKLAFKMDHLKHRLTHRSVFMLVGLGACGVPVVEYGAVEESC